MFRRTPFLPVAAAAIAAAATIAACGSNSPSTSGSGQPTRAQTQQDVVRFSACMRSHGVPNFPDPDSQGSYPEFLSQQALGVSKHTSVAAKNICKHLLPPNWGQSPASARHTQAQITAMLAFARCIRTDGFPSFPDPTGSGELTHEMLASAGINLHQPAVLQAADECVSVTHGVITKAIMANVAAGH
jgi:hypothetical protein